MAPKKPKTHKVNARRRHPGLPGPAALRVVDVFLFLADARSPGTSFSLAAPYLRKTKRIYVLAKADLAEPGSTELWLSSIKSGGAPAFAVNCRSGAGVDRLLDHLRGMKNALDRKLPQGVAPRPIRLMLFGPPNVGKSSLANRLLGTSKAPFGARPGLTRGSHWLKGRGFLEVLDTPGVLDASLLKGEAQMKMAAVWALRETAYDPQEVAIWLAAVVAGFDCEDHLRAVRYLEEFGRSRGFLQQGGRVDFDRTSKGFVKAFREGSLGRHTLEQPPKDSDGPYYPYA